MSGDNQDTGVVGEGFLDERKQLCRDERQHTTIVYIDEGQVENGADGMPKMDWDLQKDYIEILHG